MKTTTVLASLALAGLVSFAASLFAGVLSLEVFSAVVGLYTLAFAFAAYGRTPRPLVIVETPALRGHSLRLAV